MVVHLGYQNYIGLRNLRLVSQISFLSWGWNDKKEKKLKFFILKNIKKKKLNQDKVLIMLKIRKRYFHSMGLRQAQNSMMILLKMYQLFIFSKK